MTSPAEPEPLAAFSFYLAGRNRVVLALAQDVDAALDRGERTAASDRMWLWTLGAYEVVRTMCQAQRCFAARFYADLSALKVELEHVRVPNTKMERIKYDRRAASIPIRSDRDPDEWDEAARDLLVGDPARPASSRALLARYQTVLGSLARADVVMSHEDSFERS